MSMQTRQKTLVIAAVLGVLAAALVWSFLAGQKAQEVEETQIVVAATNIPANATISAEQLKMRGYRPNLVPPGALTDYSQAVKKTAAVAIPVDRPILGSSVKIVEGITTGIPLGMRAVTIGLDPVIGVAGLPIPGDHVDVLATFEMNETSYVKTVLQDLVLFAVGSKIIEEAGKAAGDKQVARTQPTATLLVTPPQAERLIIAEAKGKLRLALRPYNESYIRPSRAVSVSAVMGVAPTKSARASAPASTPTGSGSPLIPPAPVGGQQLTPLPGTVQIAPPVKTVTVVRGTKVEETVVPE